jgi:hypothetical protein
MANYQPTGAEVISIDGLTTGGQQAAIKTPVSVTGFINFAGSGVISTQQSVTSSTTLVASGLSANLVAGGIYIFEIYLSVTCNASGGLKASFSASTATATAFTADTWGYNTTTVAAQGNITSLASNLVALTGAITAVDITGCIQVNAAGTFALSFAQNASFGTATSLNFGSNMWIQRIS